MIGAILKEIGLTPQPGLHQKEMIETLYFGGGTPSILVTGELARILEALRNKFEFATDIEITLEANPDDISIQKLSEWRSVGINRLSLGIQSFLNEELKWMNRAHNASQSVECLGMIREAGFINFSVDLIYGSPLLNDEDWLKNIAIVLKQGIPHISAYALTVEPKTALDKMISMGRSAPIDPDKQARQFILLMDCLESAGYEHYEISNFAKPGMRSRHNSNYWAQGPTGKESTYYGFGPSAHSFDGRSRRWNIANNPLYIQSLQKNRIPVEEEILTPIQKLNEYIMTSLRTMEGLDLLFVADTFGNEFKVNLDVASEKWQAGRKMVLNNSKLVLTKEGKLFADGIAADLFF